LRLQTDILSVITVARGYLRLARTAQIQYTGYRFFRILIKKTTIDRLVYEEIIVMSRRKFIRNIAGAGAALTAGTIAAPANAAKKRFMWKLVTTWPPNFPIFQEGVERFAKEVKKISDGRLTIQVFAGGQLVPPLQTFDAVSQGTVQMGHGAAYYWAGKVPAAQFFTAVPFGMNAQGMNAWFYGGGGLELWREVYKPFGLTPFPMGNTGVQMGGWFRKKIDKVGDLKGLKMRIPGLGGKVMAKAGVNPVLMAGGEIYTALERGALDATEWVGPYHDLRLGLYR
jgi:TRAP-type mannitol/chloroaromatic compound transport system substrate-binding protein